MSGDRKSLEDNHFREKSIPSRELWEALTATLNVFGSTMKDATILELQKSGMDLEKDDQEHTLADLGQKLSSIFGKDGTEVILKQISSKLRPRCD